MDNLEFVSYDGESFPSHLCSGTLIMKLNRKIIKFPFHCLVSGGLCYRRGEDEIIEKGKWSIDKWPEGFPEHLKQKTIDLVNENVREGCCGGCL